MGVLMSVGMALPFLGFQAWIDLVMLFWHLSLLVCRQGSIQGEFYIEYYLYVSF